MPLCWRFTVCQGSAKEEEDRAFSSKQGRLQLAQVLGLDQPAEEKENKPEPTPSAAKGWGESIAMKIVDNMQIFIDKVLRSLRLFADSVDTC